MATRKLSGWSDSACHPARNLFACGHEITRTCLFLRCRCGFDWLPNRPHRRCQFVFLRPAGPIAAKSLQRSAQTQHRRAAPLCCRGRQSSSGHSCFGGQGRHAYTPRQLPHLFQDSQPPSREQSGRRISHDLLDGIQTRLRLALGIRQTGAEHARVRAHAAQGRAENIQSGPFGNTDPHRVEPTLGLHRGQIASAVG